MTVYDRIRQVRKAQKMSQEELAHRVGYSDRSSIAWIEKGRIDLPQSKLSLIAKALGVSSAYLLDGEHGERLATYYDKIVEKFKRLDAADQARIDERIDMMLEADKYHENH